MPMKQAMKFLFLGGCLSLFAGGLWAQRYPAQIGWFDDVQRGFATAQQQGLPVVLFVRDFFGGGYIGYNDARVGVIGRSLLDQMQRSGARWRWQRYEEDLFTQPEVAQAVAPFVRVRLALGYQRLDQGTQNLLLATGVLTDVDLVWRTGLLDSPYKQAGSYVDVAGHLMYTYEPATTLDEVLSRERTALLVLSSNGQVLYRFPPPGAQAEPTVRELLLQLQKVLAPYRALAEGRANLGGGRAEAAIVNFRSLTDSREPLPDEVRQAAQRELDGLAQRAAQALADA